MKCSKCGSELKEGLKFCLKCGQPVSVVPQTPQAPRPMRPQPLKAGQPQQPVRPMRPQPIQPQAPRPMAPQAPHPIQPQSPGEKGMFTNAVRTVANAMTGGALNRDIERQQQQAVRQQAQGDQQQIREAQ